MTLARTWRTSIVRGREAEYEAFARDVSLPMFRRQDGFLGAIMSRHGTDCVVTTLWRDNEAIAALGGSRDYQQTVGKLKATGVLTEVSTIEVTNVHLVDLEKAGNANASEGNEVGEPHSMNLNDTAHNIELAHEGRAMEGAD